MRAGIHKGWILRALGVLATALLVLALAGCASGPVPVRESVDAYSWEELSRIARQVSQSGSEDAALEIARSYHLCNDDGTLDATQSKTVTLTTGQSVEVQICGFYHDDRADADGKTGITFIFAEPVSIRVFNNSRTNLHGWEGSALRAYVVDDVVQQFPADLRAVVVPALKQTNNRGSSKISDSVSQTCDYAFLFSLRELYGEIGSYSVEQNAILNLEGEQYQLFRDRRVSEVSQNPLLERQYRTGTRNWWTRSASSDSATSFHVVSDDGIATQGDANFHYAVVPGFCL